MLEYRKAFHTTGACDLEEVVPVKNYRYLTKCIKFPSHGSIFLKVDERECNNSVEQNVLKYMSILYVHVHVEHVE